MRFNASFLTINGVPDGALTLKWWYLKIIQINQRKPWRYKRQVRLCFLKEFHMKCGKAISLRRKYHCCKTYPLIWTPLMEILKKSIVAAMLKDCTHFVPRIWDLWPAGHPTLPFPVRCPDDTFRMLVTNEITACFNVGLFVVLWRTPITLLLRKCFAWTFFSVLYLTRRLKSFPWDALVYGSIMAFYLNLEKLGNRKDVSCYEHRWVGYLYGLV